MMDRFLTWFFYIWVGLVLLVNLAGIAGTALTSPSFWDFIEWLQIQPQFCAPCAY